MKLNFNYVVFWLLGIIWGTNFLFMKLAVQVISPVQVVWLRVLFGALPILFFGLYRKALKASHMKFAHHFLVMAIFSTTVPYLGFVKGTQYLKSGAAGAISGIIPLMTAFLASALLPTDKLNSRKVIGLLLGFVGVALVARLSKLFDNSSHDALYGTFFMLLGSLGYAIAMVYARKFITPLNLSSVALACYQALFALVLLTLFVPFQGMDAIFHAPQSLLALALGLGLLGTGIAFIMYYHIIERLGAVTASSVFYVPPVVALIVGAFLANEWIGFSQCAGAAIILLGVYLARNGGASEAKQKRI